MDKNFPISWDENKIRQEFIKFGSISTVSKIKIGIAQVTFNTYSAAVNAKREMHGKLIESLPLRVCFQVQKKHKRRFSLHRILGRINNVIDKNDNLPTSPTKWTTQQVCTWLSETCNLPEYRNAFEKHCITGSSLLELNSEDLKDMNIEIIAHKKKILKEIEALKKTSIVEEVPQMPGKITQECVICLELKDIESMQPLRNCNHSLCRNCISRYISEEVKSKHVPIKVCFFYF